MSATIKGGARYRVRLIFSHNNCVFTFFNILKATSKGFTARHRAGRTTRHRRMVKNARIATVSTVHATRKSVTPMGGVRKPSEPV